MQKKKFGPIFKELFNFLPKNCVKLSNIWVWDPGSEIRDPRSGIRKKTIPDPGSRGQKGIGSRIRIRNTANTIPGFGWPKLEQKFKTEKKFGIKNYNLPTVSLGLHKECPSYRWSLQLSKENTQRFKTWNCSFFFSFFSRFLWVILPSWIRIRIHWPDWIRIQSGSGSETLHETRMK
jgi:hypothetical protein